VFLFSDEDFKVNEKEGTQSSGTDDSESEKEEVSGEAGGQTQSDEASDDPFEEGEEEDDQSKHRSRDEPHPTLQRGVLTVWHLNSNNNI
jgi:hypothetical protein